METPQFDAWMSSNLPNNLSTQLLKSYPAAAVNLQNFQTVAQVMQSELGQTCSGAGPSGMPCSLPILATGTHTFSNPNNGYQGTIRIDQNFSKDRLYFNYIGIDQTQSEDYVRPTWNKSFSVPSYFAAIDWTHLISATMVNEASMGGTHNSLGIVCKVCEVPSINSPIASFGDSNFAPINFAQGDIHWKDIVSLSEGKHTIKAGIEIFENQDFAPFTSWDSRPTFNFNNIFQFAADTPQSETGPYTYNPLTGQLGRCESLLDELLLWRLRAGRLQDETQSDHQPWSARRISKRTLTRDTATATTYSWARGPGSDRKLQTLMWRKISTRITAALDEWRRALDLPGSRAIIRTGLFAEVGAFSLTEVAIRSGATRRREILPTTAGLNLNLSNPTGPYPQFALCTQPTLSLCLSHTSAAGFGLEPARRRYRHNR